MRLENRVQRLEAARAGGGVTVMWRHHTETDDQAVARWHAEHPGVAWGPQRMTWAACSALLARLALGRLWGRLVQRALGLVARWARCWQWVQSVMFEVGGVTTP